MKKRTICLMVSFMTIISLLHPSGALKSQNQHDPSTTLIRMVGDKSIDFTLPDTSYIEASGDFRALFEMFVPETNRLICGFLTNEDFYRYSNGLAPEMDTYILVESLREVENMDWKPQDFKDFLAAMGNLTTAFSEELDNANEIINERLKSIDIEEIEVSEPKDMGIIINREDLYATGLLFKTTQDETMIPYFMSMMCARLKERLIVVYLYKKYVDASSIESLVSLTKQYASALKEANPGK